MEAVQDASKALELDAQNAKAYLRKGCACSASCLVLRFPAVI